MASSELQDDSSLPAELLDNETTSITATTTKPSRATSPQTTTPLSPRNPALPRLPSSSTSPTLTQETTPPPPPTKMADGEGERRRRRRKPLHPQKSLSLLDPNFRGVTLCFQIAVQGDRSQLLITPFYSKNLARFQRRRRRLCFNSESDPDPGNHSPPEDGSALAGELQQQQHFHPHQRPALPPAPFLLHQRGRSPVAASGGLAPKSCASCATRRTPLWRDAEDGTPLCNACGIRYRKYRLRCGSCWHIPRKDNKVFPACSQCGGLLRFSQARKC